jgi:hypothetical protein
MLKMVIEDAVGSRDSSIENHKAEVFLRVEPLQRAVATSGPYEFTTRHRANFPLDFGSEVRMVLDQQDPH